MSYQRGRRVGDQIKERAARIANERGIFRMLAAGGSLLGSRLYSSGESEPPDEDDYIAPVVSPWLINQSDEVVVSNLGGVPIILGKLFRAIPDFLSPIAPLIGQVYTHGDSQSAADTGSTADTSNYASAMSLELAVPNGTYRVIMRYSILLAHSASSTAHIRTTCEGNNGTAFSLLVPSGTANTRVEAVQRFSSVVVSDGSISMQGQFKANAAGTVSARNPAIYASATRIS